MARLITDYLDETVKKFGDKTAFVDSKRAITFKQLQIESKHIAERLIKENQFKSPIAVFLDKSVECISSFLGIAYSGNFYTMLDTEMPMSRIEKILGTLEPLSIITDKEHYDKVKEFSRKSKILLYEDLMKENISEEKLSKVHENIIDSDVLYVLFTSGSTGIPKGVVTSHRAVIDYIDAATQAYDLTDKEIIGNQGPLYFVISIIDVYGTIRNGSTTFIISPSLFMFPSKLLRYIKNNKINFLYWVPSAFVVIANINPFEKVDISCVKKMIFGGEVMPIKQLNVWRKAIPNAMFVNAYGPTEITDGATYYILNREFEEDETLPIGIPFNNCSIILLDENNREVKEIGKEGEFCVRGNSLAYGYYKEPEKTAEVFTQNPLNKYYPEKIYHTGDLVRYNNYGEMEHIGRKDFQIKHMGHRVELGEIEANVSTIDGVDENCCVFNNEKQHIILFYTGKIDSDELGSRLKAKLPNYMIPNQRIKLGQMPRNLNGKIDRTKLKEKTEM
ncbi:amino acid adenylation domain-containing protein [uncultured Treponema sp.]|uniref:amino acid adenylation domain-containing protein n=1 Tax=uncultured Treponema sp. TaxID=162155 RepID=UPI0025F9E42E|nr:amino acid adenylation domain-containing protein [uncultured Treponema sp.]